MLRQTKVGKRVKTLTRTARSRGLAGSILKRWKEIASAHGYKRKAKPAATVKAMPVATTDSNAPAQQKSDPAEASAAPAASASSSTATTASSSQPATSSATDIFAKTESVKRRKVQMKLFEVLQVVTPETTETNDWPKEDAVAEVAVDIETCIDRQADAVAKPQDYLKIVKRLLYNLKKNHKLRGAVVRSYLPAHALVIMEPSELATDEARSAKHAAMEYDKGARRSNWKQANAALMAKQAGGELEDSMYTCPKCKSRKVTNFAMQTRSADEPMTVFCTCIKCGYAFRR